MRFPRWLRPSTILVCLTLLGALLRFYNLSWDHSYFLHPDERNIGYAISRLDFAHGKFDPEFWAYGSLPIYMIYLLAWIVQLITGHTMMTFEGYLLTGRYLSALCSTALIPLTYILVKRAAGKVRWSTPAGLLAALWVAFLPGMIQFAHFTTFETFLTLQYVVLIITSHTLTQKGRWRDYLLVSALLGITIGTKIISLAMVPLLGLAHLFWVYNRDRGKLHLTKLIDRKVLAAGVLAITVALALLPFYWLDIPGFRGSMKYEGDVARGTLPVFYTQQFVNTVPGVYQLTRVFPYILTIPLTIISIFALGYFLFHVIVNAWQALRKHRRIASETMLISLILLTCALYLGFHLSLYVKWTRYMIPVLPLCAVLGAIFIYCQTEFNRLVRAGLIGFISLWVIFAGMSFWQEYRYPDPRVQAADWAEKNITDDATISSEIYDLGIITFDSIPQSNINLLNLYDLEHDPNADETIDKFNNSDYFFSLSSRIWSSRLHDPKRYPLSFAIYHQLFANTNKWRLAATFNQRDIDCQLWSLFCLGGYFPPDETFFIFDRPTVRIFQRS